MGESYERAYRDMIRVQQLQELEEAIAYSRAPELARLTHDSGELDAKHNPEQCFPGVSAHALLQQGGCCCVAERTHHLECCKIRESG